MARILALLKTRMYMYAAIYGKHVNLNIAFWYVMQVECSLCQARTQILKSKLTVEGCGKYIILLMTVEPMAFGTCVCCSLFFHFTVVLRHAEEYFI